MQLHDRQHRNYQLLYCHYRKVFNKKKRFFLFVTLFELEMESEYNAWDASVLDLMVDDDDDDDDDDIDVYDDGNMNMIVALI